MKRFFIIYTLFLNYYNSFLNAQNCKLDDKKDLALINTRRDAKHCDKLTVIKYCLKYKNSNKLDAGVLGQYLLKDKDNYVWFDVPKAKSIIRLERFTALYYMHHEFICIDTSRKNIIRLKFKNDMVYDNYKELLYSDKEDSLRIINFNIKNFKEDYHLIAFYYKIIKAYIKDYEKHGEEKAKENYLQAMKKREIEWQYDY